MKTPPFQERKSVTAWTMTAMGRLTNPPQQMHSNGTSMMMEMALERKQTPKMPVHFRLDMQTTLPIVMIPMQQLIPMPQKSGTTALTKTVTAQTIMMETLMA